MHWKDKLLAAAMGKAVGRVGLEGGEAGSRLCAHCLLCVGACLIPEHSHVGGWGVRLVDLRRGG